MTKSRNILPPRRPWTEVELELLRRNYADSLSADLAQALDRPITQVYSCANRLGLAKSDAFKATDKSGRILKGGKLSVVTQFKPGIVPWNKGSNYVAGGRSAETRFQPGVRPHTWKPVGSYRINADGYLDQKVSDTRYAPRDWRGVHRLVWEAANGPTPVGMVVVFRPGRRTTDPELITLDAVECITRRELMARNTVHNLPKPLAELVQLRGAINRQINRRAKEQA